MRLSRTAAGLATLRPRARARFPCAPTGRFPHAGSVALLAATLHARSRPLLLHGTGLWARSATTLFRGGLTCAPLLGRTWTVALLSTTTALLRAWTSALVSPRRRTSALLGGAAVTERARNLALVGPAFTFWRRHDSMLLWLSAGNRRWLAALLGTRLTTLLLRRAGLMFPARCLPFDTTRPIAFLRSARCTKLRRLSHLARRLRKLRSLHRPLSPWMLTPWCGGPAGSLRVLLRRDGCRSAGLLGLAGASRRVPAKTPLLAGAQWGRRRNVWRGLNGRLPLFGDRDLRV